MFARFDAALRASGYIAMSGQIVDATLVAAPRQRNTEDEKKAIKESRIPEAWKDKPAKLRQKDRDARWIVKFSKAKERPRSRLRGGAAAQGPARQDQHGGVGLGRHGLSLRGQRSLHGEERLRQPHSSQEAERPAHARRRPSGQRHQINRSLALEHVFAERKNEMGLFIRTIGINRARVKIGMTYLVYNFRRLSSGDGSPPPEARERKRSLPAHLSRTIPAAPAG